MRRTITYILIFALLSPALCAQTTEQRQGYSVSLISLPHTSAYLLTPDRLLSPGGGTDGGLSPAIILLHDHGAHFTIGKEKLVRPLAACPDWQQEDSEAWVRKFYDGAYMADSLARAGFVVIVPDAPGWGSLAPILQSPISNLQSSIKSLNKALFNHQPAFADSLRTATSLSWLECMISTDREALDYLCTLPSVDIARIYSFGFSMGAVRSWCLAASDNRIAACAFSNWMTTRASLAEFNPKQLTGPSSYAMSTEGAFPGLDYPEIAAMVAPRPMLMMYGESDPLFAPESITKAAAIIAAAYPSVSTNHSALITNHFALHSFPVAHFFSLAQLQTLLSWLLEQ